MGAGEESAPVKQSRPSGSTQETQATPAYPDWSSSMQAYYGAGATPPFFASTIASPTPHPYIWGGQHPMMAPYGTPVPYPALYPPGGVYAHPNLAVTSTAQATTESEGKVSEGKDHTLDKKAKVSSGNTKLNGVRAGESGKAPTSSGNDGVTQSAESASDGSSDTSDQNTDCDELCGSRKGSFHQMLVDASAQNSGSGQNLQASLPGNPAVPMPPTNLNMGMDLWNTSPASGTVRMRPNSSNVSQAIVSPTMIGRESMIPDQWVQDERELKRQKRKQSNRESARRSRLRKQAECEDLQARVESLNSENQALRDELQRLKGECEKLTSENNSIKEELTRLCGPEAISNLEIGRGMTHLQSRADEGKS